MSKLVQPLKWHGGKHYLASRIIELMPPRAKNPNAPAQDDPGWLHFVSCYTGGGAVELEVDPEGISEVWNDLNSELANFWNVLRCPTDLEKLRRFVEATPFSADIFDGLIESGLPNGSGSAVDRAWQFFIRARQSRQGLIKDFATLTKNRTRRGMQEAVSSWLGAIEGLADIHARLKRVVILNDDALKVIKQQDGPRTLFYLDPPYLHETRVTTGDYAHEMSVDDHERLLQLLGELRGRFILSGYPSKLYEQHAAGNGWYRVDIEIDNKASSKATKEIKTECLWMNYEPASPGTVPDPRRCQPKAARSKPTQE